METAFRIVHKLIVWVPGLAVVVMFVGAWRACNAEAWERYPMPTMPNSACSTGGIGGKSVWVWTCVEGEHVVITSDHGDMFATRNPTKHTAACGEQTEIEARLTCRADAPAPVWKPSE